MQDNKLTLGFLIIVAIEITLALFESKRFTGIFFVGAMIVTMIVGSPTVNLFFVLTIQLLAMIVIFTALLVLIEKYGRD